LNDKKNLKSQKSLIERSFEESWSILFNGRDTTLVKRLRNLLITFVMLQKCFKNFIVNIQKSQVPRMRKSNTSRPTAAPYLKFYYGAGADTKALNSSRAAEQRRVSTKQKLE
jgi:hypothetical protein